MSASDRGSFGPAFFVEGAFSAAELARSMPFDFRRKLRGGVTDHFIDQLLDRLSPYDDRVRTRKPQDEVRLRTTLEGLVSNLLIAAFNRVDPARFVAVSFNRNDYRGTDLSPAAMTFLRNSLAAEGLIEGQRGFLRTGEKAAFGRRTRLRATKALLDLFRSSQLDRTAVSWRVERDTIVLKDAKETAGPEPIDVQESRAVLTSMSSRIESSSVSLPDDAWKRVTTRYQSLDVDKEDERSYAGDLSATTLYRGFKGDWESGGRIYGGWWINLPKEERRNLSIDGHAVIELDYARLHPTLLFARAGIRLDFDPYLVEGVVGPEVRDLGKRTFNRLVNKTPRSGKRSVRLLPSDEDRRQLPEDLTFSGYLARFIDQLHPIAQWFGTGEGLRLQREDSDLAIAVLSRMHQLGITVLPVHDSFIVQERWGEQLRLSMIESFHQKYGFPPIIR